MNQSPLLRNASLAFPFVLIWTSAFPAAKIGLLDSPPPAVFVNPVSGRWRADAGLGALAWQFAHAKPA